MFLTVTPNTALDKVIFIDEWTPGKPIRTNDYIFCVGGKGLDTSVALRHLGQPTTGLHFTAGKTGQELLELLISYGITPEPVWVGGETRLAHVIAERLHNRHTHVITGSLLVQEEHIEQMLVRLKELLPGAIWLIAGGTMAPGVPGDFYARIIEAASQAGVPSLVDSSGLPMLACLAKPPAVVKMNQDEFCQTFTVEAANMAQLRQLAWQVYRERSLNALVVTCGADGLLGYTNEGCYHVCPPKQVVRSAAGAGDAASAALTWRRSQGDSWYEALRWSGAVSAASVLTAGTADLHMEDAVRILPEVQVEEV
jgi:1-phosphofructokinase family hexose kinase